jgi:kynureninase
VRLGPAPVASRFTAVWDALDRLRDLVASGGLDRVGMPERRVP